MARKGGSFGIVVLVVVMLAVLLLVAQSWRRVAPTALEVSTPDGEISLPAPGTQGVASNPGGLPDLGEMKTNTSTHLQEVQTALDETNQ
jgi:hypothetical protein